MDVTTISVIIILLIIPILIGVFDVWVIMKKGKYHSISAYLIRMFKGHPLPGALIMFVLGLLAGHLFWSMDFFDYAEKETIIRRCSEYLKKVPNGS